jgi:hypothetical protein
VLEVLIKLHDQIHTEPLPHARKFVLNRSSY